uniref:F5/8 type C domain-containing protein n=1 Tax=Takifugu rubripes TaxID=31033 RepID=A0A3B5JZX9_TAKRU
MFKYFREALEKSSMCLHGLGVEDGNITDSQLSASSSIGGNTPDKARLNGNSCWMPSGTSTWIQVNLNQIRKVTGIVIQGCPQSDHWITKFKLKYSMDGASWNDYTADGTFFPGSTDRNTPDTQLLGTPVSAQYIRILPLEFSGQAGLRFDVLGCTPDCKNSARLLVSRLTVAHHPLWLNRCRHVRHQTQLQLCHR